MKDKFNYTIVSFSIGAIVSTILYNCLNNSNLHEEYPKEELSNYKTAVILESHSDHVTLKYNGQIKKVGIYEIDWRRRAGDTIK